MKKISLFLVMIFLGVGVQAQDNGFGVRAGVNIASMTNYNSKVGFHVGGMYRLQLLSDMPLFFEPGLELQFKGGKLTQSGASNTLNLVYVEVPAMIAYRFRINDKWAIQPAVGPFFSFGYQSRRKHQRQCVLRRQNSGRGDRESLRRADVLQSRPMGKDGG